jgi:hypothetical protein
VLYVFSDQQPAFGLLAREAFELARHKHYADDTLLDRWQFLRSALRLRRAAYWTRLAPMTAGRFIKHHLLLRVTPKLAAALLLWYILSPGPAQEPLGVLLTVAALSSVLALLWGITAYARALADLTWAKNYRQTRYEREQQLLSPDGWKGWRLERDTDGHYVLRPLEPEGSAPPAA